MKRKEGDRYICTKCETQVIVKKITYNGEEKLSHRNPDGTPHFFWDGKGFKHTPTKSTEQDIKNMEFDERLQRLERQAGIVSSE